MISRETIKEMNCKGKPDPLFTMHEVVQVLDLTFGRTTLFRFLKQHEILNEDNIPYQKYCDAHYFVVKYKRREYGFQDTDPVTLATESRLSFINDLLLNKVKGAKIIPIGSLKKKRKSA